VKLLIDKLAKNSLTHNAPLFFNTDYEDNTFGKKIVE